MKTIELDDIFDTLDTWEAKAKANEEAAHAALVERDAAWDEMDKLADGYNDLVKELADSESEAAGYWDELCDMQADLDEAAKDVMLLLRYARGVYYLADPPKVFWAMPAWMQKWIANV
jgi:hypothetical protein